MNVKIVVASMSVLGLISCPVFAASHTKSHHKTAHTYKDLGELPPQSYKDVCVISPNSITMTEMTQNVDRSLPNPCNPGWFNRIQLSGGINVDAGKWGSRNANIMGENYQRLSLNDVYLNISAMINDWASAFASLSYSDTTTNNPLTTFTTTSPGPIPASYSGAYTGTITNNAIIPFGNSINLEQGFMTLGNFDVSPIFVQLGRQFQDFSRYEIHPITYSLTQVMSEVLATSAKVGFIANGFNGSLYVFDDPLEKKNNSSPSTNYGASLGYSHPSDQWGWDIGAAYLYNLIGANGIAYAVEGFSLNSNPPSELATYYTKRVAGAAAYADVNTGPFSLNLRYTTSLDRFSPFDLPKNGAADFTLGTFSSSLNADAEGARPWAAGIQAGYDFEAWTKNQNVYLGYQASHEAGGLNLPESRWLVGYGIDVWKNTSFIVEWDHDRAFDTSDGGTGNNTNLVSLRGSVKFG